MKSKHLILAIVVLLGYYSVCFSQKEVKIMTWNIWHGGLHGSKSDQFIKDTTNTLNVLKVIKQNDPDIIFMQETYCCGMEIAEKAGVVSNKHNI